MRVRIFPRGCKGRGDKEIREKEEEMEQREKKRDKEEEREGERVRQRERERETECDREIQGKREIEKVRETKAKREMQKDCGPKNEETTAFRLVNKKRYMDDINEQTDGLTDLIDMHGHTH